MCSFQRNGIETCFNAEKKIKGIRGTDTSTVSKLKLFYLQCGRHSRQPCVISLVNKASSTPFATLKALTATTVFWCVTTPSNCVVLPTTKSTTYLFPGCPEHVYRDTLISVYKSSRKCMNPLSMTHKYDKRVV